MISKFSQELTMETRKLLSNPALTRKPVARRDSHGAKEQARPTALGRDQLVLSRKSASIPAPPQPAPPPPVPIAESLPQAVDMALKGEAVRVPGGTPLTVQALPSDNGLTPYDVRLGGAQVKLITASPQDIATGLAYFQQVPDHLKPSVLSLDLGDMASNTFKVGASVFG